VNTYSLVAIEDLYIISDAGWGEFMTMLEYKAEEISSRLVKTNPSGTSQECSKCEMTVSKELSERTHHYAYCGLTLDRDVNAAGIFCRRCWLWKRPKYFPTVGTTESCACGAGLLGPL